MVAELEIGDAVDLIGSRFEFAARLGRDPNDTCLFRTRMAPGKLVPLHSHRDPECFYVLDGQLDIFLMDDKPRWHAVRAGESLLAADGIRHASRNSTDRPTDMVLATNNRCAAFLREACRSVRLEAPFEAPSPDAIERILRASDAYGYWNASPDESALMIEAALSGRS